MFESRGPGWPSMMPAGMGSLATLARVTHPMRWGALRVQGATPRAAASVALAREPGPASRPSALRQRLGDTVRQNVAHFVPR